MGWHVLLQERDSFENYLREKDVIPTLEERQRTKKILSKGKHRKLIWKTDQPTDNCTVDWLLYFLSWLVAE